MITRTTENRFQKFRIHLWHILGIRVFLLADGRVCVRTHGFSTDEIFRSLQEAIDHYAYVLPANFTNPTP